MKEQWLVLRNKQNDELSITTRSVRNIALKDYFNFKLIIPDIVENVFATEQEAKDFVSRVREGEIILKKLKK